MQKLTNGHKPKGGGVRSPEVMWGILGGLVAMAIVSVWVCIHRALTAWDEAWSTHFEVVVLLTAAFLAAIPVGAIVGPLAAIAVRPIRELRWRLLAGGTVGTVLMFGVAAVAVWCQPGPFVLTLVTILIAAGSGAGSAAAGWGGTGPSVLWGNLRPN
jgi:hypothetical protein